jgi:Ca-activated chloride channel family protein
MVLMVALFGCGGGGGKSAPSNPGAEVLPAHYDFGTVTPNSTPAPLVVKINSVGTTNLTVSNIVLSDQTNFSINLSGGPEPCGGSSPTLGAGATCTFEVAFHPTTISPDPFTATIQIANNHQTRTVQLSGTSEAVTELTVRVNQAIADCSDNTWTAYVSVTDQAGYPYAGLTREDFSINAGGNTIDQFSGPPTPPSPISVVAVLDYSGSITDHPEIVSDMEDGLIDYIKQMGPDDQTEIIKFADEVEVVLGFSADEAQLEEAIRSPFNRGSGTSLYDAVYRAVEDLAAQGTTRKAILVLTDGIDNDSTATDLAGAIAYANGAGIPVFPIALGASVNLVDLGRMAEDTGGQLYEAPTSDNIRNSYWQLAALLFQNQYVLSFNGLSAEDLIVTIDALGTSFEGTRTITLCP